MKTIQNLTHRQFTERAIVLGDKIINTAAIMAALVLLVLPFVLMIARLS
ncbi:MAG: hypothetical protein JWQ34_1836 [Mucilaginibacter sp.]|nr:hypothetical protein [Mucilaginibacter sp.]MDB5003611.1 hypothetical protein [Mucilaginibacter sp.]